MKIVSIANQKGGVGKTAIASHFAFYLRDMGLKVLLVDLDPQGNASTTLKTRASSVTSSMLFQDDSTIEVQASEGITLIAADPSLADLERANPQVIATFRTKLLQLAGDFDVVIIDTAPTMGLRLTSALVSSNFVLCPIELESYSIDGITRMLQTIFGVQQKWNPKLTFLGMLPNRFNSNSVKQKENLKNLLANYAHLMINAKIGNRSSISDALADGIPVWEIPKTAAREAAKEMKEAFGIVSTKMEGTNQ